MPAAPCSGRGRRSARGAVRLRLVRTSALLGLAIGLVLSVATPASAAPRARFAIRYYLDYSGSEVAKFTAIGKVTSFTPAVAYWSEHWIVTWRFSCIATVTYTDTPKGDAVGCDDPHGDIWGHYVAHNLVGNLGSDCSAHYFRAAGGTWGVHGTVVDSRGYLKLYASMPPNGPVIDSTESCGFPPAVDWHGDIDTVFTTPSLYFHVAHGHKDVRGTSSPLVGRAAFESDLYAQELGAKPLPPTPTNGQAVMSAVSQWLTDRINQLHETLYNTPPPPAEPPPVVEIDDSATLTCVVVELDPSTLVTLSAQLRPLVPTRLRSTLTAATLKRLAALPSPPRLRISLTLSPARGSPLRMEETFVPSLVPEATSVTFSGSAADPTVTVHGSDFGPLPAADPKVLSGTNGCPPASGTYGTDYGTSLALTEQNGNWGAGRYLPGTEVDCIGIVPTRWSASSVTFTLGSFYTANESTFSLKEGDQVQLVYNGTAIDVHVAYGSTVSS